MKKEIKDKLFDAIKGLSLNRSQKESLVKVFDSVGFNSCGSQNEIPNYDITHIINSEDNVVGPAIITQDEGLVNIFNNNETFKIIMDVNKIFGQNDIYIITMNKDYIRGGKKYATGSFGYITESGGATTGSKLTVTINKEGDGLRILMGVV